MSSPVDIPAGRPSSVTSASSPQARPIDVCVIFGGQSSEHSISCLSAASVLAAIDRTRYRVQAIGITSAGTWCRVSDDPAMWRRDGRHLPSVVATEDVVSLADISADVVFPVLHGPYGEDGTIQGALELRGIPYVGSGVLASALTMDKHATKRMLQAAGLPVGVSYTVTDGDWSVRRNEVLAEISRLQFPLFVKPSRAGSSVGISKVHELAGIPEAIAAARVHDRKVVIEESVENAREVEIGVLAGRGFTQPRTSVCAEILVAGGHEFYDFEAKYLDDSATLVVPAELSPELGRELADLAIRAFEALDADGLARVDFFVSPNGVVINEVNTMPGFTEISLFPRMWEASGVTYSELVDHLIAVAIDRGAGFR